MQHLTILNTREVREIKEQLEKQFGYAPEEDYAYLKSENHDRIFIINKEAAKIDFAKLRIDKMGLYFAEIKNNRVRLSKEGAQLLWMDVQKKKKILKNTISLSKEEVEHYFKGNDLEKELGRDNCLILLQYQLDILGCAQYKDGRIINFLPKIHRGTVIV